MSLGDVPFPPRREEPAIKRRDTKPCDRKSLVSVPGISRKIPKPEKLRGADYEMSLVQRPEFLDDSRPSRFETRARQIIVI